MDAYEKMWYLALVSYRDQHELIIVCPKPSNKPESIRPSRATEAGALAREEFVKMHKLRIPFFNCKVELLGRATSEEAAVIFRDMLIEWDNETKGA